MDLGGGGEIPPPYGDNESPNDVEKLLSGCNELAVHGMSCFSELFLFLIRFNENGEEPFRFRRKKLLDFFSLSSSISKLVPTEDWEDILGTKQGI